MIIEKKIILNYFKYDVNSAKTKAINAFYLHKMMIQNPKTTNEWSSMYYFGARLDYQQVKVSSFQRFWIHTKPINFAVVVVPCDVSSHFDSLDFRRILSILYIESLSRRSPEIDRQAECESVRILHYKFWNCRHISV